VSEYFSSQSIGDVGGQDANYIPKRGFPGTLAPGENFKENQPFSGLSKKIYHPWPAMQEFQFHVRMPANHPMLPPPLLWFGLNNMYTENFTNAQLNLPSEETVGGMMMNPKDAIRIARHHKIGMCYEQEDQLPHGGMIFKTGRIIPFYNPDHGPTVSDEEAKPPIPVELLPVTERWLDPHFGLMSTSINVPIAVTEAEQLEADDEEALRRAAAERLMGLLPALVARDEEAVIERRLDEEDLETRRVKKMLKLSKSIDDEVDELPEGEERPVEPEVLQFDRRTLRMQEKVARGFARDPRTLITYTIETIREMQDEVALAEKDLATKKKYRRIFISIEFTAPLQRYNCYRAGRRRQRKEKGAVEELPDGDALPFDVNSHMHHIFLNINEHESYIYIYTG
jgi:hypothetical protein